MISGSSVFQKVPKSLQIQYLVPDIPDTLTTGDKSQ